MAFSESISSLENQDGITPYESMKMKRHLSDELVWNAYCVITTWEAHALVSNDKEFLFSQHT